MDRDITALPEALAEQYGAVTTHLNLSFNCLSSLEHLDKFPNLEDLTMDNNALGVFGMA
jgi:hypothetical protein